MAMWTSSYLRQIDSIVSRGVEYGYRVNRSETRGNNDIVKHLRMVSTSMALYQMHTIIIICDCTKK